jgi:hypothetical protein
MMRNNTASPPINDLINERRTVEEYLPGFHAMPFPSVTYSHKLRVLMFFDMEIPCSIHSTGETNLSEPCVSHRTLQNLERALSSLSPNQMSDVLLIEAIFDLFSSGLSND